jgi:hypothetical protein
MFKYIINYCDGSHAYTDDVLQLMGMDWDFNPKYYGDPKEYIKDEEFIYNYIQKDIERLRKDLRNEY